MKLTRLISIGVRLREERLRRGYSIGEIASAINVSPVFLEQLEQGRAGGFDAAGKGFSKKDDKANKIIWIVAGSVGLVIVVVLVYVFLNINR